MVWIFFFFLKGEVLWHLFFWLSWCESLSNAKPLKKPDSILEKACFDKSPWAQRSFPVWKLSDALENLGMQHVWNCQTSGILFGIHQDCGYNNRYFAFALTEVFCHKWVHSLKIHLLKARGFAFTGKDVTLSSIKKLPASEKQLLPLWNCSSPGPEAAFGEEAFPFSVGWGVGLILSLTLSCCQICCVFSEGWIYCLGAVCGSQLHHC